MSQTIEAIEEGMVQHAIQVLNEALAADPKSIEYLFKVHGVATPALVQHPTIQVVREAGFDNDYFIRVLGLINGLFGVGADGYGKITAVYDNEPDQPERLLRFERTVHNHR